MAQNSTRTPLPGQTPLHVASTVEIVEFPLNHDWTILTR
jgi:hypothetical protein